MLWYGLRDEGIVSWAEQSHTHAENEPNDDKAYIGVDLEEDQIAKEN